MEAAEGSRRQVLLQEEDQFGVLSAVKNMDVVRNTGGAGLGLKRTQLLSNEWRADRRIASMRLGNKRAEMELPFELSYASFDKLLAGAFFGKWTRATGENPVTLAVSVAIVASAKTFTRASGSFITDGFSVGDRVTTSGFVNAANNMSATITALSATVMTFGNAQTLADETLASGSIFNRWGGLPKLLGSNGVDVEDGAKTFTRASGSWITDGVKVGDWITFAGFGDAGNNGTFLVSSVTALEITCATAAGLVDTTDNTDVTFFVSREILKQGIVRRSFTIEEGFTDIEQYQYGLGFMVNTLALSIKPDAIVTGSFGLIGRSISAYSSSSLDETPNAANVKDPFDAFTGYIKENGVETDIATGLDVNLNNGADPKYALFDAFAKRIGAGRANLTGTATFFFEDAATANKYVNETESDLEFKLTDPDGDSYVFTIPRIKFTDLTRQMSENDGILSMPLQALSDETEGTTVMIEKIPASA